MICSDLQTGGAISIGYQITYNLTSSALLISKMIISSAILGGYRSAPILHYY